MHSRNFAWSQPHHEPWALPIFGWSDPLLALYLRPVGGPALAGSGRAVLRLSGAEGKHGRGDPPRSPRAIATLGRQP